MLPTQVDASKMLSYHNGSYISEVHKIISSVRTWKLYSKVNENLYIFYSIQNGHTIYAPLYVHRFKFIPNRHLSKYQILMYDISSSDKFQSMAYKLRWHRMNNGLFQSDVADKIGVSKCTYMRYETGEIETYPLDMLSKISDLFKIEITDLLDDYHLFLYQGQAQQIKKLRKTLNLTQLEFAKCIDVPLGTLKKWEKNSVFMRKKTFIKIKNLQSAIDSENKSQK